MGDDGEVNAVGVKIAGTLHRSLHSERICEYSLSC